MSRVAAARRASPSSPLFLSGGGTGGHVYPALAVAEALNDSGWQTAGSATRRLLYVGSTDGMEQSIVARESTLLYSGIPAAALRGRGPLALLRGAGVMAAGFIAAQRLLRAQRPAAILGTGGYVCVPLFLAARSLGVPTMIYLPDVVPGLAVRSLARIANRVACNVVDSAPYFGLPASDLPDSALRGTIATSEEGQRLAVPSSARSLLVTGYPVRAELFDQDAAVCRRAFALSDERPVLLVYGGSRGARSVNRAIEALLPVVLEVAQLIHICGREGDEQWLQAAAERLPAELRARYRLYPYLESGAGTAEETSDGHRSSTQRRGPTMVAAFGAADLAVCRSGASTLAELPAAGLPAVLVPYPYVHQDENADYLVQRGAAQKVTDGRMLGDGRPEDGPLWCAIKHLLNDKHERQRMAEHSRALARPDAARCLAAALLDLATRS